MIAQRLKTLRTNNNYSQQEVADKVGISRSTYAGYEKLTPVDVMVLMRLAKLYNVTSDSILFGIDGDYNIPCEFKDILKGLNPSKTNTFWLHLLEYARYLSKK